MRKLIIEGLILITVFFATMIGVNSVNNKGKESVAIEMAQATLPVVYTEYGDTLINCLHGYVSEIDASLLQAGITPLDDSHTVRFWIDEKKNIDDVVTYEVRNLDDGSLIEDGTIEDMTYEDGYMKGSASIRMDLADGQNYLFVLKNQPAASDTEICYYTRIMQMKETHTSDFLKYAIHFSNALFDKEDAEDIRDTLQSDKTGNNSDLSNVNLHSDFDTLTYADLSPSRLTQAIPTIKDLSTNSAVIELKYVMTAGGGDVPVTYYNMVETFQIRYDIDLKQLVLGDYERKQEQSFNYKDVNTLKNYINLGIADSSRMEYMTSDDEEKVAFVREGQLWYYDYASARITMIFGFWQNDYTSIANTYDQHAIQILGMDDKGNIAFATVGYMNRGEHEGQNGIAVYRYDAATSQITEVVFLEEKQPYQILNGYTSKVMYLSDQNVLYLMLDDVIYAVKTGNGEVTSLVSDVAMEDVSVSADGSIIAFPIDGEECQDTQKLMLYNLESGAKTTFTAEENTRLKALGFVGSDVVYGVAKTADIVMNENGTVTFPMYKVEISNISGELLKEYQVDGTYITSATTDDTSVYFDRVVKDGDQFVESSQDFITYKKEDSSGKVTMSYVATANALNTLTMLFPNYIYVKTIPKLVMTKVAATEETKHYTIEQENTGTLYYVYSGGNISEITKHLTIAVSSAEAGNGYVMDEEGQTIWKKSMIQEYFTINDNVPRITATGDQSLAACLSMMIQYEGEAAETSTIAASKAAPEDLLSDYLPEEDRAYNISGISLDEALYFLSNGAPVLTQIRDGSYVLITSYNAYSIRYISPSDGTDHAVDRDVFEDSIAQHGNYFISYLR